MTHNIKEDKNYLLVDCLENYDFKYLINLISLIKEECNIRQVDKVVCDLRKVNNLFKTINSEMERFYIGEEVAKQIGYKYKLAAVLKKNDINHFGETVANNRGGQMKVFSKNDTALKWLLEHDLS